MKFLMINLLGLSSFFSSSFATTIPSTITEVIKLVIYKNGDQMITTPVDTKVSIFDWYLSTLSQDSQDLTETGSLFNRIDNAICIEKNATVTCSIVSIAQEFVPLTDNSGNYCAGADYGEGISVVFAVDGTNLKFLNGEINISMSGDGPCGANW